METIGKKSTAPKLIRLFQLFLTFDKYLVCFTAEADLSIKLKEVLKCLTA